MNERLANAIPPNDYCHDFSTSVKFAILKTCLLINLGIIWWPIAAFRELLPIHRAFSLSEGFE